ncbi:MAG TPA: hypothetical protein VMW81_09390 [Nitrospinota bacterium]|nr:hypothetical protein [Nitrospinota bacterium]
MNNEYILQNLEKIADSLNVKIQYDEFKKDDYKIKSSLCRVRNNMVIFVDKSLRLKDKIDIILNELTKFDLDHIYIPPKIRELINNYKGEGD